MPTKSVAEAGEAAQRARLVSTKAEQALAVEEQRFVDAQAAKEVAEASLASADPDDAKTYRAKVDAVTVARARVETAGARAAEARKLAEVTRRAAEASELDLNRLRFTAMTAELPKLDGEFRVALARVQGELGDRLRKLSAAREAALEVGRRVHGYGAAREMLPPSPWEAAARAAAEGRVDTMLGALDERLRCESLASLRTPRGPEESDAAERVAMETFRIREAEAAQAAGRARRILAQQARGGGDYAVHLEDARASTADE